MGTASGQANAHSSASAACVRRRTIGRLTWEPRPVADAGDFDIVGLTVRPEPNGGFRVAGVAAKDGPPTVNGVRPGDALLRVDELDTARADMGSVVDALRGEPGTMRTLVIERAGTRRAVAAAVVRLP